MTGQEVGVNVSFKSPIGLRFTGRMRGHQLNPGRYLLTLTPRANGHQGRTIDLAFRIVK